MNQAFCVEGRFYELAEKWEGTSYKRVLTHSDVVAGFRDRQVHIDENGAITISDKNFSGGAVLTLKEEKSIRIEAVEDGFMVNHLCYCVSSPTQPLEIDVLVPAASSIYELSIQALALLLEGYDMESVASWFPSGSGWQKRKLVTPDWLPGQREIYSQ